MGVQGVVNIKNIINIVYSKYSSCLYEVKKTSKILPGIISQRYIDGGSGESADNCKPGKETTVYNIEAAVPRCELTKNETKETKEILDGQETKEEPLLTIMYKGIPYKLNIRFKMTIETLKSNVLNMLVEKGIITNKNYNIKFIYNGKVVTDNSIVLDSLNSNGMDGQTMQVMLSPITGGKRNTRQKKQKNNIRKQKIRKTMKINR